MCNASMPCSNSVQDRRYPGTSCHCTSGYHLSRFAGADTLEGTDHHTSGNLSKKKPSTVEDQEINTHGHVYGRFVCPLTKETLKCVHADLHVLKMLY